MFESHRRPGLTLLELLVVLTITAILMGLLIPAVLKVRSAALHAHSTNNVKQIGLALHGYADTNGRFPRVGISVLPNLELEFSFFVAILPYLEQTRIYDEFKTKFAGKQGVTSDFPVPVYENPLDPTGGGNGGSYAASGEVFNRRRSFKNITDGTSNTAAFAEHYSYDCGRTAFYWTTGGKSPPPKPGWLVSRRATFADKAMGDVYPVSSAGRTAGSVPGVTFQAAPALTDCNPALAQAPSPRGLIVGVLDGTVKTLAPSISESTYWGLITFNGGEVLSADW